MVQAGLYRHYKGNTYQVIGIAKHSETEEDVVVYRALYGECGLWVNISTTTSPTTKARIVVTPAEYDRLRKPEGSAKSRQTGPA